MLLPMVLPVMMASDTLLRARKRKRREALRAELFLVTALLGGRVLLAGDAPRTHLERNRFSSTISCMLDSWPDAHFKQRLRVTKGVFNAVVDGVAHRVRDSCPWTSALQVPARFKVGVALYHLAHGGDFVTTSDVANVGVATVHQYVREVCAGIISGPLKATFMRKPTDAERELVRRQFALRRGITNVDLAVDGTHVPWRPDNALHAEDYHNYKGWHSLNVMAFVNSYFCFVDAEVGYPGRANDAAILDHSALIHAVREDPSSWLGPNGVILGDGGCGGVCEHIMPPYDNPSTNQQRYFNFCLSSTRFFIEQTFGMWKNRWRVVCKKMLCTHRVACLMICATMVLHNMCISSQFCSLLCWRGARLVRAQACCAALPCCCRARAPACLRNGPPSSGACAA
jgi:hypothetical protein